MLLKRFSGKLAVFCSDERFVKPALAYLNVELKVKECDIMAVPGGPAFIAEKDKNLVKNMKFLVKAHRVKEIFLFMHEDCGYYKDRYKEMEKNGLYEKQLVDLQGSFSGLKRMFKGIKVRCYYQSMARNGVLCNEFIS